MEPTYPTPEIEMTGGLMLMEIVQQDKTSESGLVTGSAEDQEHCYIHLVGPECGFKPGQVVLVNGTNVQMMVYLGRKWLIGHTDDVIAVVPNKPKTEEKAS